MKDVLDALDLAFADPPEIDLSDGCTACYSNSELDALAGDPALVPDDLVSKAVREDFMHWSPAQWRALWHRLAPRVVRLIADRPGGFDVEDELQTLDRDGGDFASWPEHRQVALEDAFGALLDIAVTDGRPGYALANLVGALSATHQDLRPWLARIDDMDGTADAGVVDLAWHWAVEVMCDRVGWWWLEDGKSVVREWVWSTAVLDRVHRFAVEHPESEAEAEIEAIRAEITG